jgi:methyl-accepting chemotaxis protein
VTEEFIEILSSFIFDRFIDSGFKELLIMQMPLLKEIVSICFPIDVGDNRCSPGSVSSNSFSEIPDGLFDIARSLEDACKNIEPDFLQIGEALQTIYGDANDLTEKTLQSVGLIGAESNEGILVKVKDLVSDSLSEIKNCREGLSKNLHHVRAIIEQLEGLYNSCSKFLKTVRFLKVLGLNIRIESSRSPETLDIFSVVIEEIKEVSEKVSGITQIIRYDTKVERASLASVHGEISAGLNQLGGLARDAEKAVKGAARKIEQIAALSSKALEHSVTRSREISSTVSNIVVEIQFHDSMRQRIEHIANALFDVKGLCTEQTSFAAETEDTIRKKWGSVHSILRLQAAQLQQIISEVDQVYEKSTRAFKKLMNEVGQLSQSLSPLVSHNLENRTDKKGYSQGPLEILQSSLQHLQGIIGQGRSLFERMERSADRASGTTDRLSTQARQVQEVGSDTHILSLNAILKAIHLGNKGKTLQVLSQEITSLSDQSDEFVSTVGELLESITFLSRGLQTRTPSDTEKEQLDKISGCSLDNGIQEITEAYKRIMLDSDKVFNRSEALSNAISQTRSCLGFLPELTLTLKEHLQRLQEIDQALIQQTRLDLGDVTEESGEIVERYTMQQEREIHEEFLELKSNAGTKSYEINNIESDGLEEVDNFGDNVELF